MKKSKLTDRGIKSLKCGDRKQLEVTDTGIRLHKLALVIVVGVRAKTWYVRYSVRGQDGKPKRRRRLIGHYPAMSLSEAHEKATEIASQLHKGNDPFERDGKLTGSLTFDKMAKAWRGDMEADGKLKTWNQYWSNIRRDFLERWKGRPAAQIRREDLEAVLREIAYERGSTVMADRSKAAVSAVYRWARKRGKIDHNPAERIGTFAETSGVDERVLSWEEISTLWPLWDADNGMPARALQLALLSGQRVNEVLGATWEEIDEEHWWTIPGRRTKNGKNHRVWLGSDLAQGILGRIEERSPWLFPSSRRTGPIENARKPIYRFRRQSGIEDWSFKHLRGTFASRAAEVGIDPLVISLMLNHTMPGPAVTRRHYNLYHYDPQKRHGWQTYAEELSQRLALTDRR